ncbi:CBS domain-containing protein [Rhizobium sp. YJ-22]|uniref:CBS domain-containing protein n=1 Tax=Rhizobium sp. YJ-22 TaxID=3037556 RepID=UPI0024129737|nr:CBS domain-containing protein [Rhizobium sp. YJ-22]MDG3578162.1 CBS domain-containing protein [Rhizobium sp. YJ-22]
MKVRDVMTRQVVTAAPNDSVQAIARLMADIDTGAIPIEVPGVGNLVGVITDRDIVLRVVAEGLASTTAVSEIMTVGIENCQEDDDIDDVARRMTELSMRRLVVYDANRELSGIVTLHDIVAEQQRNSPHGGETT